MNPVKRLIVEVARVLSDGPLSWVARWICETFGHLPVEAERRSVGGRMEAIRLACVFCGKHRGWHLEHTAARPGAVDRDGNLFDAGAFSNLDLED